MNWTEASLSGHHESSKAHNSEAPQRCKTFGYVYTFYFLILVFPSSRKSAIISCFNVCLHQVILHQEILLLWGQRHRVENPKPPLSSWSQRPQVYLLTVRERLPPRYPPHRVYPAWQNVPNCPPLLQSVLWDDLLMLQVWTKGQYHPQ